MWSRTDRRVWVSEGFSPGARIGFCTGGLLGAADGLLLVLGESDPARGWAALGAVALTALSLALLGGLLGVFLRTGIGLLRASRPGFRPWPAAGWAALPLIAFFAWVPSEWIFDHYGTLGNVARIVALLTYPAIATAVVLASRLALAIHAR